MPMITPVLMCGGTGTRLWPLSRESFPKQFTRLTGDLSMFQDAALRLSGADFAAPVVITAAEFRFIVSEQLATIGITPQAILLEPCPKNTAPALLVAALYVHARNPGTPILASPTDHLIPDAVAFRETVLAGLPAALNGRIVTFGIRPTRAETGYGWIEPEGPRTAGKPQPVRRFVEKPDAQAAQGMFEGGQHLWNAGLFLATAETLIQAAERHAPTLLPPLRAALASARPDLDFLRLDPVPWAVLPGIAIDHAVMERATNLSVLPYDGAWSDLGDWAAVWRETPKDAAGNTLTGASTAIDCAGSLLHAAPGATSLMAIGLTDMIAVALPDAVLIAPKDRAQDVRHAVAALHAKGIPAARKFPQDHRPWGWFETLATGPGFQVKRITVIPGGRLSLQSHQHRAEHWVVVSGNARITLGQETLSLTANQSTYIPQGTRHRLENPGSEPVILIEVQTGAYLAEDDITRHEDAYARP